MRTKTFVDLLLLSSNLYLIAQDKKTMSKLKEYSEKGKEKINSFMSEKLTDEEGNELEFVDKMKVKIQEAKKELEEKIEHVVEQMYDKMKIAHKNDVESLEARIEELNSELTSVTARMNDLESK